MKELSFRFALLEYSKKHNFSITRVKIDPQKEVSSLLEEIQDASIDFAYISAHGTASMIELGKDFEFDGKSPLSRTFTRELRKKLHKSSILALDSCHTGSGNDNIAKILSRELPYTQVYAPISQVNQFKITQNKTGTGLIPKFYNTDSEYVAL